MPQMSPMNWLFLFLFFNFSLYLGVCKIYFLSSMLIKSTRLNLNTVPKFSINF